MQCECVRNKINMTRRLICFTNTKILLKLRFASEYLRLILRLRRASIDSSLHGLMNSSAFRRRGNKPGLSSTASKHHSLKNKILFYPKTLRAHFKMLSESLSGFVSNVGVSFKSISTSCSVKD